ncbi:hypothetical protein BCV70DRAFT_201936 [Testicularia cyperi]|uniref:RING-type domain-containing protein n=1 Tax=Testicularia cyperi TaxID=1882483 RepID=A0A317XJV5_9BASI|nr:hypothetical protein BCV70DRAFT_201936 [Testicularia cyperi]
MEASSNNGKARAVDAPECSTNRVNTPAALQNAIVSIWPVQLRDLNPEPVSAASNSGASTSRKSASYVPLERIEFEDVSYSLNLHDLCSRPVSRTDGALRNKPDHAVHSRQATADGEKASITATLLKRKRSPSLDLSEQASYKRLRPNGAISADQSGSTPFIDTHCLFRVKGRDASSTAAILQIKDTLQPQTTDWLDNLQASIHTPDPSRPQDSLIESTLVLRSGDTDTLIAQLPILYANADTGAEHRPDKLTNSDWIASLLAPACRGLFDVRFSLAPTVPPADIPAELVTAGTLFLKLRVEASVATTDARTAPLAVGCIRETARVVRFADPSVTSEEEQMRRSAIDASFIYGNLRPAKVETPDSIQPHSMAPTLLPFQRRSTAFLLGREGKKLDSSGCTVPSNCVLAHDGPSQVGLWWRQIGARPLFYNWIEARFVVDPSLTTSSDIKGAMLAEEMGLGKTVEIIALILLNTDHTADSRPSYYDPANEIDVWPTKTTLIVCPETLRGQWLQELDRHAPGLRCYSYGGRQQAERGLPSDVSWEQWARGYDVIVVSYSVLSRELDSAKSERPRSRRHERRYERPRSPLIKLHFARVVMDEVQMVGNSKAAETAAMIARESSIAVSGTPVKRSASDDLRACFRFLRVPGYLASNRSWAEMLDPLLAPALVQVLRTIATRSTKAQVAQDMLLPIQTRAVVPIDFTSIESAFYADVWKDALEAIDFTPDGNPATPNRPPDIAKMRDHLLLLRQACTHPQIAVTFRGGVIGSRNLRSIDEVLELMIDSTKSDLHSKRNQLFEFRILTCILSLYLQDEDRRVLAAAQMQDIEVEIRDDVAKLEEELQQARSRGPLYTFSETELDIEEKEEARRRRLGLSSADLHDDLQVVQAGQGSEAWQALCQDAHYAERRKQRSTYTTTLKTSIRNLLIRLHRNLQFLGNLYFQRGEYLDQQLADEKTDKSLEQEPAQQPKLESTSAAVSDSLETSDPKAPSVDSAAHVNVAVKRESSPLTGAPPESLSDSAEQASLPSAPVMTPERQKLKNLEDQAYADAEKVRQRLLTEKREEVEAAAAKLRHDRFKALTAASIAADAAPFEIIAGTIQVHDVLIGLSEACKSLNDHAKILFSWRESIQTRLVRAVNRDIDLENDADDQYQEHLDTQAEAECLLEMYRPLLSERENILKGTVPVGSLDKPHLFRELEAEVRAARQARLLQIEEDRLDEDLVRVQEQQLQHFKRLDEERKSVSLRDGTRSFQELQDRLKRIRDSSLREEEAALVRPVMAEARRIYTDQTKILEQLRSEERTLLTPLFNARSLYFKEIQALSDTVRDPVFSNLERSITTAQYEARRSGDDAQKLQQRLRYLLHLQKVQSADEMDEETKRCHICTDVIVTGILTNTCGHVCCESCWKEWTSQGHRTCVLCQTRVLPKEVHRIVYRTNNNNDKTANDTIVVPAAAAAGVVSQSDVDATTSIQGHTTRVSLSYNEVDGATRDRLNRMAIHGRFGSKIDQVVKHVKHILETTGEKSLIFSSFARGLDVVAQSLTANGIRYVRLGSGKSAVQASQDFGDDVPVMLLHSEVSSSGLNLMAATHIHILEPLLKPSLELQAIGRVHRIGQTKETYVWCYYAKDTVEERILALGAYRGQSLYLRGHHTSAVTAASAVQAMANGAAHTEHGQRDSDSAQRDARNWASLGDTAMGTRGQVRGDVTSSANDLFAVYFAKHLPRTGPGPTRAGASIQASATDAIVVEAASRVEGDEGDSELARMRRARLAALDRRIVNADA